VVQSSDSVWRIRLETDLDELPMSLANRRHFFPLASAAAPVLGTMDGPLRLYPLRYLRLAMPLRKEAWLNRMCSSPCQKAP
jgi:hypothetical protein